MRRSTRRGKKQTNSKSEAQRGPKAKQSQSDDRISNIAAMDNETMIEAFKYLNYFQLATSSHVSKRFWNLIRTHRHKLALLDVEDIYMKFVGLKNSDECQAIESIWGTVKDREVVEELKRNSAEFIADEEQTENSLGVGFINNDIEKKLTFSYTNISVNGLSSISIKITDL